MVRRHSFFLQKNAVRVSRKKFDGRFADAVRVSQDFLRCYKRASHRSLDFSNGKSTHF